MAEQEVIKHTKKVVAVWGDKEKGIWHKIKDFLLEIFIIVFAVTISIWFHQRSEHSHQQKDVKDFLLGLKKDLISDTIEMKEDRKSFVESRAAFTYLSNIKLKEKVSGDSLKKYTNRIFNTTGLVPNIGRFEGFKSSGKIGTIENKVLQNDIMDLYQENIPMLILSTDYYTAIKQKFFDYFNKNLTRTSDSTYNDNLFTTDEAHNLSRNLTNTQEIINRYNLCIVKIRKIVAEINKDYGDED